MSDMPSVANLPPNPVLEDILTRREVELPSGESKRLVANVDPKIANILYRIVLDKRRKKAFEIGMAYGVSTLSILTGLGQTDGSLVSIDPYIGWPTGRKTALLNVEKAGFSDRHSHLHEPSYSALPRLLSEGRRFDFAYIDGAHDFDNVFIDSFYTDLLLEPGGIVGFNDVGWPGVWPVVKRIIEHENYEEVDVGLKPDFRGRTPLHSLARRVLNRPRQDRFFRKLD